MFRTRKLIELMAMRGKDAAIDRLLDTLERMTPGDAADSIGSALATSIQVATQLHVLEIIFV